MVSTLADPAGKGILDELPVEQWINNPIYRPLNHSVAKRQGHYQTFLGFVDIEFAISAHSVLVPDQLILQLNQITLQIGAESQHLIPVALILSRLAVRQIQIFKVIDLRIQIFKSFQLIRLL